LGLSRSKGNSGLKNLIGWVKQLATTKRYLSLATSTFIMSSNKNKKHQFCPAMNEASSPIHDEHVKKIREQEKT
jgi:hypothetical protein